MAQVVETVTARTMAELVSARNRATGADLVELRLDGVRDVDVAGALAGRARPVVVTCRPGWEGGRFDGGEEERLALLGRAIRFGAEYVDVEWKADRRALPPLERTRLVLSSHDFDGIPADLTDRVRAMRGCGADIVKVSVTAHRLGDCLHLKQALADGSAHTHVAIAMGAAGQLTRIWPAWFGSCWTYTGAAAPGQLSTRELVDTFRVRTTTAQSAVYGVAGSPLGHSASPAMHNAAFEHLGLDAVFVPLETTDASELLEVAEAIGLAGASVTAPLKTSLFDRSTPYDDLPRQLGAINTLRPSEHAWESCNFDVPGFLAPIERRGITLRDRHALVIGAGGAARAAVWALQSKGARVAIAARRPDRARTLATAFGVAATDWPPSAGWDVLVNTTPVGTWPRVGESPLERAQLASASRALVYDLVYNPPETTLMRWAREAGAEVIGGLEMLVSQACRQFEWWTGQTAPHEVMAAAALAFVRSHETDDI